jgi:hypothetical protein
MYLPPVTKSVKIDEIDLNRWSLCNVGLVQGDQIWRIFAYCFLWIVFLKNTKVVKTFRLLLYTAKSYILILTKMGWATFWAIFSQTHLVTLALFAWKIVS